MAAYDSQNPDGFSREDTWVLHKAALAAGLVWQLRQAETDLKKTVERLQKVDSARQLLLKNVSTAADKIRRRFASELHDDALQKLTAAQLHLQRVNEQRLDPIHDARDLLFQAEEALRKLLFEVRPPALELPGGFEETIRDRLEMLRSLTGIKAEAEFDLPDDDLLRAEVGNLQADRGSRHECGEALGSDQGHSGGDGGRRRRSWVR